MTDPDPVSINLSSTSISLKEGETKRLSASVLPDNAPQGISWSVVSGSNVASVSSSGLVTAKAAGTATVRATSTAKSSVYRDCMVTVTLASPLIQFADAKVKELCVANWDTNSNGELSETEAAAVTDLGEVFNNKTGITSFNELQYFTGLTSIGSSAFEGCRGLTSITIPESVTSIGGGAFWGCSSLTSITIPNSVTSIGGGAFWGCSSLTSITIPNSVTNIGDSAFRDCSGLTSVTIPNSVTYIGVYAFEGCSGLTSVTIPNSVTSIGDYAFRGCSGLTSVIIPNGVTSIGKRAFWGCSGLTSITIPNSVTYIGNNPFANCPGLTSIVVDFGNTKFDSRDDCNAIIKTATNTLITGSKNTIIPNNVTSIGDDAFYNCSGLTSITIPNSVTSIGYYAFRGCSGLTSVIIPNGVTSIGEEAFYNCSGLTSVTIPNSVTTIGNDALSGCSGLTSITIPNSVTKIGSSAFYGCSGLTSITIGSGVTRMGSSVFGNCSCLSDVWCYADNVPDAVIAGYVTTAGGSLGYRVGTFDSFSQSSATLHVPAGSVEAYKTTTPWSGFGTIVAIEDVTLGDLTGDGKVSITDIVMIVDVIAGDITDANQVAAADVNGDGKVSITDCSAAVDLIAAGTSTPSSARRKANAMLSDTDFISGTLHDGLLSIGLEAEHRFTAFQMTVSVPEGMTLGNGSMNAQRGADHLLTVRNLGGGRYLVAGFSADNDELTTGNGCLLTIATEGQASADIVISDIEFATAQAEAYYLADAAVSSTPTGLNSIVNGEMVNGKWFDLQGRRVTKATKGIYIYNGKKTMIK